MSKKFYVYKWMTAKMGLSGNGLVMFAYLWDATKQGSEVFTGGYRELSAVVCTTVPTVYNTMRTLQERGFIEIDGDGRSGDVKITISKNLSIAAA